MDLFICESCYKGTILQRNYKKITISYNFFVICHDIRVLSHNMTMLHPNSCYDEACYKGTALYQYSSRIFQRVFHVLKTCVTVQLNLDIFFLIHTHMPSGFHVYNNKALSFDFKAKQLLANLFSCLYSFHIPFLKSLFPTYEKLPMSTQNTSSRRNKKSNNLDSFQTTS